jgi:hypothetical protein
LEPRRFGQLEEQFSHLGIELGALLPFDLGTNL